MATPSNDGTGAMHVIDIGDPARPREVAQWKTDRPDAGRTLHDIDVQDGLAYLSYWNDGLVVIDVGNGIKGGSPENPQFVSQLRFNYSELYGPGWVAGAHSVFRYKNYVFLGDEVFPGQFDLTDKARIPTKGVVHVVDVSDILNPRKVAEYDVPARLPSVSCPVLVVHGRDDPIPAASSKQLAQALGGQLVMLADSGHVPYVERPAELFTAVRRFLAETDQQRA